jgi:hypothetical protein
MSSNAHPKCWARSIGGCSNKLSGEHIVSQSIFESEQLTVQGLAWCKDAPKTIGLSSLTAKILCREHNSELSELDSAAGNAIRVIRQAEQLEKVRRSLKPQFWTVVRSRIDGPKLERWFLKTLINVTYENDFQIGTGPQAKGIPSADLVEIAFGRKRFTAYEGLYVVGYVGQRVVQSDSFQLLTLMTKEGALFGGIFLFRGFRFLLSLSDQQITKLPSGVALPGDDWTGAHFNHHNQAIRMKIGKYLSQVIEMTW